jgi:porin
MKANGAAGRLAGVSLLAAVAVFAGAQAAMADDQGLWSRDTLLGDFGGLRSQWSASGFDVGFNYTAETLGTVSGGMKQGWIYEGRATLSLDFDLAKLANWSGATAHASAFQIHHLNGMPAADYTGSIGDPSNIEARHSTRLFTAWIQQNLFDDALSIRAGQLAADDEFLGSATAGNLINGTFGWAPIVAANLTQGGPAYPVATPGIRIEVKPASNLAILAAAFSGNPGGRDCTDEAQICDPHGTKCSMSGGTLWMGELQYSINQGENAAGLPGVYKIGGFIENGAFADQRYGLDGLGAVVPLALAVDPLEHRGNHGIYAVADQTVWKNGAGAQSVNLFLRAGGAPDNRNLVSFYVDGGVGITGLVPGRDKDVLTFGVAHAKISSDAAKADEDTRIVNADPSFPIRDQETIFEVNYLAEIAPWWSVQPDVQYIVHPGGNVQNASATGTVGNAWVVGVRTSINF